MASARLILRSKSVANKASSIRLVTISHPLVPKFNEDFCREKIGESINGLESLYNYVDYHFLLLPCVNSANGLQKWADEALDEYLGLLDVCATTKDVLSRSRQNLQQLLSILRIRRHSNDFEGYLSITSKAKKEAHKSLKNLKALLSHVAGTTRPGNWSMVRKLTNKKRNTFVNGFEKINDETIALATLAKVKDQLRKMDASLKGLEEGLDCMSKRLIRIRVSLLNVLNN